MSDDTTTQAPETVDAVPAQPAQPAQPPAQLQLSDILLATQLIQVASTRGAFKVEEYSQIGGVYERLVGFLQASGAITPANSETAPTQGN
jgi:hypothetical protein